MEEISAAASRDGLLDYNVPLIIRGEVVAGDACSFGGRGSGVRFSTPDITAHLDRLMLTRPSAMADLLTLGVSDILDYLHALGQRLSLESNVYLQDALALSIRTSGLSEPILRHTYSRLGAWYDRDALRDIADKTIGIPYLEGWVDREMGDGCVSSLRAFGARSVHIIAGNTPGVAALTIARNALVRSDAVIKTPSNDPATAVAIARTMIDMAPDHPITRHLSVAYWKGGDERVERSVYQPSKVEKIIAWGGFASISHISKYLQPGIDLITLDPKLSSTIIGREAFADDASMAEAARRLAKDVGFYNQEACLNARVVYVESGTDDAGLANANRLGEMLFAEIQALPPHRSGPAANPSAELADEVESLKIASDWHKVIGGGPGGAVIVSQMDEPVDFARILTNRVVNLVPVDDLDVPIGAVNAYTQTIGIYPESLKARIRDRLAIQGAQRIVSLGAAPLTVLGGPQDGIEPLRRMCKWIADESRTSAMIEELTR